MNRNDRVVDEGVHNPQHVVEFVVPVLAGEARSTFSKSFFSSLMENVLS